ncbi:MAG: NAD(+) diphosphatase [Phocaeicola sp.]
MNQNKEEGKSYWFAFHKNELIVEKVGDKYAVPCQVDAPTTLPEPDAVHDCGELEGIPCKAYALTDAYEGDATNNAREMMDLRVSYDYLPFDQYYKGGKAVELLYWDKNSRFCPACGIQTERISPIGKKCNCCNQEFYPQVSPAMIIRIRKEDSILLVRAKNFRGTFRGLVAGFVETGESLEECVHREVFEETGLIIENVKYFGSQPWPYPSVLMIGFTADYKSGELNLQEEELTAGAFFTKEDLPELPRKLSLARKLIDAWIEEE